MIGKRSAREAVKKSNQGDMDEKNPLFSGGFSYPA
jgi:hypothetical protein